MQELENWHKHLEGREFSFRCPHCSYHFTGVWEQRFFLCPQCHKSGVRPTKRTAKIIKNEFLKFKREQRCISKK